VTATLRGTAVDLAHHDDLQRGTLKEELHAPGFELFTGEFVPREAEQRFEKPTKRPPRDESAVERRERERRERAREALRVAESEGRDWRRRADELERAVEARRKPLDEARKAVEQAKAHLTEAQDRLKDEERAAEQPSVRLSEPGGKRRRRRRGSGRRRRLFAGVEPDGAQAARSPPCVCSAVGSPAAVALSAGSSPVQQFAWTYSLPWRRTAGRSASGFQQTGQVATGLVMSAMPGV
jgi:hypothetical protein